MCVGCSELELQACGGQVEVGLGMVAVELVAGVFQAQAQVRHQSDVQARAVYPVVAVDVGVEAEWTVGLRIPPDPAPLA